MSADLSPAFVLHARRYGESHLLLDMLTLSQGRLPVMARGAGSARSIRRALLQPFIPLLASWAGRGSIANLRQVEARGHYRLPRGMALYSGFYVNELILRLLETHEPVPELFSIYENCVEQLSRGSEIDASLRRFELAMLRILGYGVELSHEADHGRPVQPDLFYTYESELGIRCAAGNEANAVQGSTLLALAGDLPMDDRQRQEAKHLMRRIIGYYLGDRPLRSRELFR
ncbi:DNA repair protein RecO [Thiolapillus sp.]